MTDKPEDDLVAAVEHFLEDHGEAPVGNPDAWCNGRCIGVARLRSILEARAAQADGAEPIATALRRLRGSLQNLADTARDEVPEIRRRGKLNVAIANARSARSETNVAAGMAGLADDE